MKFSFVCVTCGTEALGSVTQVRCSDCRNLRNHRKSSKPTKICKSCMKEFKFKASQIYCLDCKPKKTNKTRVCKVCLQPYSIQRNSIHICSLCIKDLLKNGKTFCVDCNSVVDLNRKSKFDILKCVFHLRESARNVRIKAIEKGTYKHKKYRTIVKQTQEEKLLILQEIERGLSVRQVAEKFHFTQRRVRSALISTNSYPSVTRIKTGRVGWMTSADIKKIFGWSDAKYFRLRKYIKLTPYGLKRKNSGPNVFIIKYENFDSWIRNKDFWMLWEIEDLQDSYWKKYCLTFRDGKDYWMTMKEASITANFEPDTISTWLRKGKLKGVQRNRIWYVWTQDLKKFMIENYGVRLHL